MLGRWCHILIKNSSVIQQSRTMDSRHGTTYFFTREFRNGVRPIEAPNDDTVIINACEAAPYKLAADVKRRDKFWIKPQPEISGAHACKWSSSWQVCWGYYLLGLPQCIELSLLALPCEWGCHQDSTSRWKLLLRRFSRRPSPYRIASVSYWSCNHGLHPSGQSPYWADVFLGCQLQHERDVNLRDYYLRRTTHRKRPTDRDVPFCMVVQPTVWYSGLA